MNELTLILPDSQPTFPLRRIVTEKCQPLAGHRGLFFIIRHMPRFVKQREKLFLWGRRHVEINQINARLLGKIDVALLIPKESQAEIIIMRMPMINILII